VVLFTALIGPHFVEWTSYRETFEREASAYIGRPVTVNGKASVRLLPTPVLSFTDIHIGAAENPDVEMERFHAEVELAPLLKGEVKIIQMAVERPRIYVDIAGLSENRGLFAAEWRLDPDRISLGRLEITEGSAVITDSASGRTWQADAIDAELEASTLIGPGRVTADMMLNGEPMSVRAGFGRFTNFSTVAMNLWVTSPEYPVTLSTDGTLNFSAETPPSYEGIATVEGIQSDEGGAPRPPWADFRASGPFSLTTADLTVEEMQISYGAMERPLIVEASGQIFFGETPRFDLVLGARQIDLDRTLGGGEEGSLAIGSALASLVDLLPRAAPPPLPGVLRLEAQGVVVGGSVVQAVGADLVTAGDSWVVEDFAALLPGDTRVDLEGTLGLSADAAFTGRARMTSKRPAAFATWWRGSVGSARAIGEFSVEAGLDVAPGIQRLSDLVVTTANGTIEGSVALRRFAQSGDLFADIGLRAARADLAEARALAELLVGRAVVPGRIDQMNLSLSADVLTAGGVEARSVALEGGLEGGVLNLTRLNVGDLAGAGINARGSIRDPFGPDRSGRIDAAVEAEDIGGAARFLLSVLPESPAVRRFAAAAPVLSPVSATIVAEAGAEGEKVSLELNGRFADTHLTLRAEGSGSLAAPETLKGTLSMQALGGDSTKVLQQLGFDILPVKSPPLRIAADFDGELASGGALKMEGSVAGIDLGYDGTTAISDGSLVLEGGFSAESVDIDQALLLAGVAVPGIGEGHSASAAGDLRYSDGKLDLALSDAAFNGEPVGGSLALDVSDGVRLTGDLELGRASLPVLAGFGVGTVPGVERFSFTDTPFAETLPANVSLDVALSAAELDLGAPIGAADAKLDFMLEGDRLEIDLAESAFAGGTLKGSIGATMSGGQADVSFSAALEGAALQALVWERVGLPVASGTLDVSFEATGRGRSLAGIVATLGGSGSFAVADGRLNALNAGALNAVMQAAEGEADPDEDAARETFATLFGSGALAFGGATGSFSIENGAIGVPTVSLAAGGTKVLADARIDLNTLRLDSDWTVRIEEGGPEEANPYVPVSFRGPILRPVREVDLNPLLDLMRSRFLERKLEELEELQRRRDEAERRAAEEEAAREAEATARQAAAEADLTTGAAEARAVPAPEPASETAPRPARRPDPAMPMQLLPVQ
jgi:hypothetical protein